MITLRTMFGVLCVYLLIGDGVRVRLRDHLGGRRRARSSPRSTGGDQADFLYFSFVTMTTTGFGDLTAADDLGRALAVTEALIGQIYLVTVVALIVSNMRGRELAPSGERAGDPPGGCRRRRGDGGDLPRGHRGPRRHLRDRAPERLGDGGDRRLGPPGTGRRARAGARSAGRRSAAYYRSARLLRNDRRGHPVRGAPRPPGRRRAGAAGRARRGGRARRLPQAGRQGLHHEPASIELLRALRLARGGSPRPSRPARRRMAGCAAWRESCSAKRPPDRRGEPDRGRRARRAPAMRSGAPGAPRPRGDAWSRWSRSRRWPPWPERSSAPAATKTRTSSGQDPGRARKRGRSARPRSPPTRDGWSGRCWSCAWRRPRPTALRRRAAPGRDRRRRPLPARGHRDRATCGREIAALARRGGRGAAPRAPLVMIDQEGGEVKRLPDLPPGPLAGSDRRAAGAAFASDAGPRDRRGAGRARDRRRPRAGARRARRRRTRSSPRAPSATTPRWSREPAPPSARGCSRPAWRRPRSISRASGVGDRQHRLGAELDRRDAEPSSSPDSSRSAPRSRRGSAS